MTPQPQDQALAQGPATDKVTKLTNLLVNHCVIAMSSMMSGMTKVMSQVPGRGGAGSSPQHVSPEMEDALEQASQRMKEMVSGVQKGIRAQIDQQRGMLSSMMSDPSLDRGIEIAERYDFGLPKLTQELDEASLSRYSELLVQQDARLLQMLKELADWMETLPKTLRTSH